MVNIEEIQIVGAHQCFPFCNREVIPSSRIVNLFRIVKIVNLLLIQRV